MLHDNQAQFHYFYDRTGPHHRPVVTVCRLFDGQRYGYGWAITSPADMPRKRTGRAIAQQRAHAALQGHGTQGTSPVADTWFYDRPIRRAEALVTLGRCGLAPVTLMAMLPAVMYTAASPQEARCRHCGQRVLAHRTLTGTLRCPVPFGGSPRIYTPENPFLALDDVVPGEET